MEENINEEEKKNDKQMKTEKITELEDLCKNFFSSEKNIKEQRKNLSKWNKNEYHSQREVILKEIDKLKSKSINFKKHRISKMKDSKTKTVSLKMLYDIIDEHLGQEKLEKIKNNISELRKERKKNVSENDFKWILKLIERKIEIQD